jgi:hypothetical protein
MTENVIVLPGQVRLNAGILRSAAHQFGWTVGIAHDLQDLMDRQSRRTPNAVLFHRGALGGVSWSHSIRLLRESLPGVPVVACHGFNETVHWPDLAAAGAFHSLSLPMKESEVRQCLGFVWAAKQRRNLIPVRPAMADRRVPARIDALRTPAGLAAWPAPFQTAN